MKKLLIILGILILLNKSNYSQEIYPKLAEINGDTVVLLNIEQATVINIVYEMNKALKQKVNVLDSVYNEQIVFSLKRDSIIAQKQESIYSLLEVNRKLSNSNSKLREQRKWLVGVGAVGGLVVGLLIN